MALGITKSDVLTKWEIPLMEGDLPPDRINDWTDNSWIVEHLRHLADKIEKENPRIVFIGLSTDRQYKCPKLYVELFESKPPQP
jgi:hypothetical protein